MSSRFTQSIAGCILACLAVVVSSAVAQDPTLPSTRPPAAKPKNVGTAPAGYLLVPGFWSLGLRSVQKEVGLTADQKEKLKAISEMYQSTIQQRLGAIAKLPPQEQQKRLAEVREEAGQIMQSAGKRAAAVLTPRQAEAIRKVDFQLRVAGYSSNPAVFEQLGLTEGQHRKLQQVFEQLQEKMQQLQRETGSQALDILTPEQAEQLRQQVEKGLPGG